MQRAGGAVPQQHAVPGPVCCQQQPRRWRGGGVAAAPAQPLQQLHVSQAGSHRALWLPHGTLPAACLGQAAAARQAGELCHPAQLPAHLGVASQARRQIQPQAEQVWHLPAQAVQHRRQRQRLQHVLYKYVKAVELTNLRSLALTIEYQPDVFEQPVHLGPVLSGMTALTALTWHFCPALCVGSLSSSTGLLSLLLDCDAEHLTAFGPEQWAAIQQLSRLTELHLQNTQLLEASPECCSAFAALTQLQVLGAYQWSPDVLPALTACTQLMRLCGSWDEDTTGGVCMPNVSVLTDASSVPPCVLFPNLKQLQGSCMTAGDMRSLCQHCKGLRSLVGTLHEPCVWMVQDASTPQDRVAALQSLSTLHELTCLKFSPGEHADLVAVVGSVGQLIPRGFKRLDLSWYSFRLGQSVQPADLVHLARLQGLPELSIWLPSFEALLARGAVVADDLQVFLAALCGTAHSVVLLAAPAADVATVDAVLAAVRQAGLPTPPVVVRIEQ